MIRSIPDARHGEVRLNLRHLEVFFEVMKAGSVSGAARALRISQPACSMMLRHAESHFGIRLFERVSGRLRPTPEATMLFPEVESIFDRVAVFGRIAKDLKGGQRGNLTVGSSPGLITALLPPAVASFRAKPRHGAVGILSLTRQEVFDRVRRGEMDLGVVFDPVNDPDLLVTHLTTTEIACVIHRQHALAKSRLVSIDDLKGERIISYGHQTHLGGRIAGAFHKAGVAELPIAYEVNSGTLACMMAMTLGSIALIEPLVMTTGLFPDLVIRPFRPVIEHKIQMIEPLNHSRSKIAARFASHLKATVPTMTKILSVYG
jgi:DNA-binding transcriptional LysR family regulator